MFAACDCKSKIGTPSLAPAAAAPPSPRRHRPTVNGAAKRRWAAQRSGTGQATAAAAKRWRKENDDAKLMLLVLPLSSLRSICRLSKVLERRKKREKGSRPGSTQEWSSQPQDAGCHQIEAKLKRREERRSTWRWVWVIGFHLLTPGSMSYWGGGWMDDWKKLPSKAQLANLLAIFHPSSQITKYSSLSNHERVIASHFPPPPPPPFCSASSRMASLCSLLLHLT